MRLLHTGKFALEEFFDSQLPPYCILSHRWGDDEILYADVKGLHWKPESQSYRKVVGACQLAAARGFKWIWIDTCCIDKNSSTELTEAINSMFNYYSGAGLCIAYLNDVANHPSEDGGQRRHSRVNDFRRSSWFTRGWTLQELLAPNNLEFFNYEFESIGTKVQLCRIVSEVTGIALQYLNGQSRFNTASIATRMSWASQRETTRLEDQAYSLLGIFGVHMPLLYGEGQMAFHRLQKEIIASSNDESTFAWIREDANDDKPHGMLAESPRDFRHCAHVRPTEKASDGRTPFSWRSGGLEFLQGYTNSRVYIKYQGLVALACKRRFVDRNGPQEHTIGIWLRKFEGVWYRFFCRRFYYATDEPHTEGHQSFYIPQPNVKTTPRLEHEDQDDVIAMVKDRFRVEEIALANAMAERAKAEAKRANAEADKLRADTDFKRRKRRTDAVVAEKREVEQRRANRIQWHDEERKRATDRHYRQVKTGFLLVLTTSLVYGTKKLYDDSKKT